jgi:hypothetical protein
MFARMFPTDGTTTLASSQADVSASSLSPPPSSFDSPPFPPQVLPHCTSNHAVDDTWAAHLSPADTTSARRLDSYQDKVTLDSVTCRARHLANRILARDGMFHRTLLLFIGLFWPVFVRSLIKSFILGPPLVPSLFLFYPSHRTPDITTPAPPLLAVCSVHLYNSPQGDNQ